MRCFGWSKILLLLAILSPEAFALPSMQPKVRDREIRVGLQGNTYLTPYTASNSDAGTGNLGVNAAARWVGEKGAFQYGAEGEGLYGLGKAHYRFLNLGEAYVGAEDKTKPARASVYLGRKRYDWNALDSYWSLGLYQPRFRWDYLNERENGLVGLFGGFESEMVQATAYFSPIYVPEQGAPFQFTGGNCRSASPWFSCPNSTILVFNQPTTVRFSLETPPVSKIISHPGGGATLRLGKKNGWFTRGSFAHKPINQFLLSFEGSYSHAESDVPAIIRPRTLYHSLFGLDLGWNSPRHSVTASGMFERPYRDETPSNWNTQETTQAWITGITARTQPFNNLKFTRFELSYLHRNGGNAADRGTFINSGLNTFEPRYAFQNAFSFAVFSPINDDWARRFLLSGKFVVDTVNDGNILIGDIYYSPFRACFLNLGIDVLGSNNTSPVDFIARYQRNDRLRGGLTYVF